MPDKKDDGPATPVRPPTPEIGEHVRHTLEWHGGTTLVVFVTMPKPPLEPF
jgi:hypothetical protein